LARIAVRKLSRSWLICSIVSDATVSRSWPKTISLAISSMSACSSRSSRSAALFMIAGLVLMPTVNVLGTLTRMFCMESAPWSGIAIVIGVSRRNA
jgi:hypothetical protein